MTTEAGKRLLGSTGIPSKRERLEDHIAAIEAEARSPLEAEVARLRADLEAACVAMEAATAKLREVGR